eukprot:2922111-Prymnesium_polylepis.1
MVGHDCMHMGQDRRGRPKLPDEGRWQPSRVSGLKQQPARSAGHEASLLKNDKRARRTRDTREHTNIQVWSMQARADVTCPLVTSGAHHAL